MAKDTPAVAIPAELRPVIAGAAKNLAMHLYGPQGPPWGTSFDEIENLAVLISRQVGTDLMQQALQRQADQPPPAELQSCPACSGALDQRATESRSVHTGTGTADWQEPAHYCPRCRRAFSPSEQEPGHRQH